MLKIQETISIFRFVSFTAKSKELHKNMKFFSYMIPAKKLMDIVEGQVSQKKIATGEVIKGLEQLLLQYIILLCLVTNEFWREKNGPLLKRSFMWIFQLLLNLNIQKIFFYGSSESRDIYIIHTWSLYNIYIIYG